MKQNKNKETKPKWTSHPCCCCLQSQLANYDSKHKEQHAEGQNAGTQPLLPHPCRHGRGGGVSRHGRHLPLPQPIILPDLFVLFP